MIPLCCKHAAVLPIALYRVALYIYRVALHALCNFLPVIRARLVQDFCSNDGANETARNVRITSCG